MTKVLPVGPQGEHDDGDEKNQGKDPKRAPGFFGQAWKQPADGQPRGQGDPQDDENGEKDIYGAEADLAQNLGRVGIEAAPEGQVERGHDHRRGRGNGGHADRYGAVAPGQMGHDVGQVAARAGGHQDHAQGHGGVRAQIEGQQEGEGRQQDELGGQADGRGLGGDQNAFEILGLHVQGDPEHHQPDGGVDHHQPLGVEVQPDLIDGGDVHACTLRFPELAAGYIFPVRAASHSHSPGGSTLASGSTWA